MAGQMAVLGEQGRGPVPVRAAEGTVPGGEVRGGGPGGTLVAPAPPVVASGWRGSGTSRHPVSGWGL